MEPQILRNEPMIRPKPKMGYSDKILALEVGDCIEIEDSKENQTAIYNAIKNVRNYQGHRNRVYKSFSMGNGKRRFFRTK